MNMTWTPPKAANRLSSIAATFSQVHGVSRFPVDVTMVALEAAQIFGWSDPITDIQPMDLPGFEGALFPNCTRTQWMLLYNHTLKSEGRIRFTQAHELGHYILHRWQKENFQCSEEDMLDWSDEERNIEAQADQFASYLLMPLDDFRQQMGSVVDLDAFSHCAERYGVSLTAVILKWLQYTDQSAVLVLSRDGYMLWSVSSRAAMKAGAFYKTRKNVVPIPSGSVAANDAVGSERRGQAVAARTWFPSAEAVCSLTEMKLTLTGYDCILTLLLLPRSQTVWNNAAKG